MKLKLIIMFLLWIIAGCQKEVTKTPEQIMLADLKKLENELGSLFESYDATSSEWLSKTEEVGNLMIKTTQNIQTENELVLKVSEDYYEYGCQIIELVNLLENNKIDQAMIHLEKLQENVKEYERGLNEAYGQEN